MSDDGEPAGDDDLADDDMRAGSDEDKRSGSDASAGGDDGGPDRDVDSGGDGVVQTERLDVPEMDCPSCAGKVEAALGDVEGVVGVDTRPTSGTVVVTHEPAHADEEAVTRAIEAAGYDVDDAGHPGASVWHTSRAYRTYAGAAFLLLGAVLQWVFTGSNPEFGTVAWWTVGGDSLLYLAAVAVAGVPILRNGYYSARNRSLDIDLLMSVGILGALAVGLPFEAATLAALFSVAELLERYSMDRARSSLSELMDLSPDTAAVIRDGEEVVVPADDVAVGETVVVRPGEKVPVDGVVLEGTSSLDESPVTGESVPADKAPGDEVYAGSISEGGYLKVEATAPAGESTIAHVIDLVEDAEAEKTEKERFVDRFAAYYTPVIVVGAVLTAAVPPLLVGVPFEVWFRRGLTLLVVACPCAFVISTPVSVVSGITSGARNGVLIKGGRYLEATGEVDAVAIDKTGTLTRGELAVTDVVPLAAEDEAALLSCAAALEARSEHPVGDAIRQRGAEAGLPEREVTDFEAITGKGVRADLDGVTHYAGKPGLFAELGFDLSHAHVAGEGAATDGGPTPDGGAGAGQGSLVSPESCEHGAYVDLVDETIPRLQAEGKTIVVVGTEEEIEGVIAVADAVRPEAAWAVERLKAGGVERVVMLTGDNERTARAIGDQVGIDEVRADLLPGEKVAAVEELAAEFEAVAMVGDGVNDAPALAAADVGVAMGAAGSDAALETADVALLADDLTRLPYLHALARRANAVIRQNIYSSLGVKVVLAIGAPLGYVTVLAAIVIGDMGMSLTVTGNALRLAGVEPVEPGEAAA